MAKQDAKGGKFSHAHGKQQTIIKEQKKTVNSSANPDPRKSGLDGNRIFN